MKSDYEVVALPGELADNFTNPDSKEPAQCLDCGQPATTYSKGHIVIVVHSGQACGGFRKRFTPDAKRTNVTPACDQKGWFSIGGDEPSEHRAPRSGRLPPGTKPDDKKSDDKK